MPRRATRSETPGDVTVKTEKIRVKQEKLKNNGKQRATTIEEEDDEQGDPNEHVRGVPEEEEEEEESAPRGNKRMRVNGEGASCLSSSGSHPLPKMKTLPRDTDGYAFPPQPFYQ